MGIEWAWLLIPVAAAILLLIFQGRRMTWWELVLPVVVGVFVILLCKVFSEAVQTRDKEYWTGYGVVAEYYESWDEEVPCTHEKYRTETDRDGNKIEVFDGYEHSYDVDDHPPYWEITDNNDITIGISKSDFEGLAKRWGNRKFVELHRDYHSNDGDKYVTRWDNSDATMEVVTTIHSYENRVQVASSVFNFTDVSDDDRKSLELVEYPDVDDYDSPSIIGVDAPDRRTADRNLSVINAKLGKSKQVRIWIVLFRDKPLEAGILQEAYWKGGNKNELVLCIGLNPQSVVQWTYVFGWTPVEELKIALRDFVNQQRGKQVDLGAITPFLERSVSEQWVRKDFNEFDYLQVPLPWWNHLLIVIIMLLTTAGCSAWAVNNEFGDEEGVSRQRYSFRRYRTFG